MFSGKGDLKRSPYFIHTHRLDIQKDRTNHTQVILRHLAGEQPSFSANNLEK